MILKNSPRTENLYGGGEVAESGDHTLVQGIGGLHAQLQNDRVDAEREHTEEDACHHHQLLHEWLKEHPDRDT